MKTAQRWYSLTMGALELSDALLLPDLLHSVASGLSASAWICAGVFLLTYRKRMVSLCAEAREKAPSDRPKA